MTRRVFVSGLLGSVSAGTALVKLATPVETEALAVGVGQPVLIGQPQLAIPDAKNMDGLVYLRQTEQRKNKGKIEIIVSFIPIGYISLIETKVSLFDGTTWDGTVRHVPGLKETTVHFKGSEK